jgi:ribose 5-phosphate isomerase B
MRVAFGSDDENETTRAVVRALADAGHEVVRPAESASWPDLGRSIGRAVVEGRADYGVVMCWTGTGTAIAPIAAAMPSGSPARRPFSCAGG